MQIKPQIKYNNVVDDETVIIGKNTPKMSQKDTLKTIEQSIDQMDSNDPARKVYEKVYSGAKKYF